MTLFDGILGYKNDGAVILQHAFDDVACIGIVVDNEHVDAPQSWTFLLSGCAHRRSVSCLGG